MPESCPDSKQPHGDSAAHSRVLNNTFCPYHEFVCVRLLLRPVTLRKHHADWCIQMRIMSLKISKTRNIKSRDVSMKNFLVKLSYENFYQCISNVRSLFFFIIYNQILYSFFNKNFKNSNNN